ncbi:MAG: hypothetical protein ACE3JQ_03155 [Paenisporosarcina sp.]
MHKKKFDWLPVVLFSLIFQYICLHLLLFIEIQVNHSMSAALILKINFIIVAIVGGLVAMYFYIKYSPHLGGACAALFIVLSQLYIGNSVITGYALFVLIVAYLFGYLGAVLYSHKFSHKKY